MGILSSESRSFSLFEHISPEQWLGHIWSILNAFGLTLKNFCSNHTVSYFIHSIIAYFPLLSVVCQEQKGHADGSEAYDQFYLYGLVGYGFKCNEGMPGVYTNMADPGVLEFVKSSFGVNNAFCKK